MQVLDLSETVGNGVHFKLAHSSKTGVLEILSLFLKAIKKQKNVFRNGNS